MRNLTLIYNNIKRRRSQTVLTVLIVSITIFIFTLIFASLILISDGLKITNEQLGADLMVIPKYASIENRELLFTAYPENVYMPKEIYDDVKKLDGIKNISSQFFSQTLELSCCEPGEEVRIVGIDPNTDFIVSSHLENDADFSDADDLVLGSNFDESLVGEKYLILGHSFNVKAKTKATGTGMDYTIFLNIDTLRKISGESLLAENLWKDKDPSNFTSSILVKLEDGYSAEDFEKELENSGIDAKVVLTGETIKGLQNQMKAVIKVLLFVWLGSLIITILSLFGRFNSLVNSRKKEIGLLRALGFRKSQIFLQMFGECSLMAFIGGLIGSISASLCMSMILDMIKNSFSLSPGIWNFKTNLMSIIAGILLSLIIGFISSIYPIKKSVSLDPREAITQGEI